MLSRPGSEDLSRSASLTVGKQERRKSMVAAISTDSRSSVEQPTLICTRLLGLENKAMSPG